MRFGQLQVAPGGLVQRHELAQAVGAQAGNLGQAVLLGLLQVLQQRARRPHGQRLVLAAEAVQRRGAEMLEQRCARRALLEAPGGVRGDVVGSQDRPGWRRRSAPPSASSRRALGPARVLAPDSSTSAGREPAQFLGHPRAATSAADRLISQRANSPVLMSA